MLCAMTSLSEDVNGAVDGDALSARGDKIVRGWLKPSAQNELLPDGRHSAAIRSAAGFR